MSVVFYPPYPGGCFWKPDLAGISLGATSVGWQGLWSDGAIALSYLLLAGILLYRVQQYPSFPFRPIFQGLGLLLLTGGVIYLIGSGAFPLPSERLSDGMKLLAAFIASYLSLKWILDAPQVPALTANPDQFQHLQTREREFRAVFEQAAVGMARLSPEGRWIQVNQKLCDLLGYSPEEFQAKTFQALTYLEDYNRDQHYYQQLLTGEIESCAFEKRYLHRSGEPIWTLVTASKEYTKDGEISCFIAVIEDIRARKQTEQQLQQRARELTDVNVILAQTATLLEKRNSELDQFAYVASHDLKAPLRAIANLSEWIEEDLTEQFDLPEENLHQLALLRGRVHRMEALINGLLEYSRVGRQTPPVEPVDVYPLIQDIVDSLALPPGFQVEVMTEMPLLHTHQTSIQQVFLNLINNAVKHHHREEGHVWIRCSDRGNQYEFSVTDDGPGIDPQYHEKVFTIFQTLKSRDEMESTGIGLAVVRKIVETEGGSITLKSTPGQGAIFQFTWPKTV